MKSLLLVIFIAISGCNAPSVHEDIKAGWEKMENILTGLQPPEFPGEEFDITDFGAKSDGSLCTEAFRQAIAACNKAGGGRVVVPKGNFVTGAIHLLSNVELHVSEGATIHFSTNFEDYLPVALTRFEGCELYNYSPFIYAYKQENIAITGKGVLDGQASIENWWGWKLIRDENGKKLQNSPGSRPRLMDMMEAGVPAGERVFGEGYYLRPNFIEPYLCKNILIKDVTLIRPPMWMIHPVLSENITISNVKLFSPDAPNGDGCNPEACKGVLVEGCEFNTGDDCIAIKSGRNKDGYNRGIPTEDVIIRGCRMLDGHGGIVIGSETSGGVKNVYVYNCELSSPNLGKAIRLKSNKYRGGVIENIYFRDIKVGEVSQEAIRINQRYSTRVPTDIRFTTYRNIFIENMVCEKARRAIEILGVEELPVENVKIINSQFNNIKKEVVAESVNGFVLENVMINGKLAGFPNNN